MHPDDKYLFEFDLDEKGRMQFDTDGRSPKFSDRAKAAQEAVRITLPVDNPTANPAHRNGGDSMRYMPLAKQSREACFLAVEAILLGWSSVGPTTGNTFWPMRRTITSITTHPKTLG